MDKTKLIYLAVAACIFLLAAALYPIPTDMETCSNGNRQIEERPLIYIKRASDAFTDPDTCQVAAAASAGDEAIVMDLVATGIDPDGRGLHGATPLLWVAHRENLTGFRSLLKAGADPNLLIGSGTNAFHIATQLPDPEFTRLALAHGADVNIPSKGRMGQTPLHYSITFTQNQGDMVKVKMLLDAGANISGADSEGRLPIEKAVMLTRFDIVHLLIERGAVHSLSVSAQDDLRRSMDNVAERMNKAHAMYKWYQRSEDLLESELALPPVY